MKRVSLTIDGMRFKTKEMDDGFVDFVEKNLKETQIDINGDNKLEQFFIAYLKLAGKHYQNEKEINNLIKNIKIV